MMHLRFKLNNSHKEPLRRIEIVNSLSLDIRGVALKVNKVSSPMFGFLYTFQKMG